MIYYVQFSQAVHVVGHGNINRWSRDADSAKVAIKDAGAFLYLWHRAEANKSKRTRVPITMCVVTEDNDLKADKAPEAKP